MYTLHVYLIFHVINISTTQNCKYYNPCTKVKYSQCMKLIVSSTVVNDDDIFVKVL